MYHSRSLAAGGEASLTADDRLFSHVMHKARRKKDRRNNLAFLVLQREPVVTGVSETKNSFPRNHDEPFNKLKISAAK